MENAHNQHISPSQMYTEERPFRKRVDDFWQWFTEHESELSHMVENRNEYDGETFVEFVSQGTKLLAEDVHFNIGGNYEFSFSVEGNSHLFYLYPYLISRMPESLKKKWHFFPFNQGTDATFSFEMYGTSVNMADVHVSATYQPEENNFNISFYEKNLCSLPEAQSYNAFYIMMDIMLGEGMSYLYIGNVERADKLTDEMIPLPELRNHIAETLQAHDKKVLDNPQQAYTSYNFKPQEHDELRYDVIAGSTCFMPLVAHYYHESTELVDRIKQFGARAVFLTFPYNNKDADEKKNILQFRYKLEDCLENELLIPGGVGLLLGGAIGKSACYIDLLLYDVNAFKEKIVPFLQKYPQYLFFLSNFCQPCDLVGLSYMVD